MSRLARRRLLVGWGAAALAAAALSVVVALRSHHLRPSGVELAIDLVVGLSFAATGLIAWARRPENNTGRLLLAVSFTWFLALFGTANDAVVSTIGQAGQSLVLAAFVHLVLAYPAGRLSTLTIGRGDLGKQLAAQSGRISRWIDALAASPSPTARQVACLLLASRYPEDPIGVLQSAETLAEDPHWEVREAAGGLLGTLLDRDFDRMRGRLEVLRSSKSENLRRSVVLAVKYAARRDRPERVGDLLGLLAPLLRDQEPYVRRNLGPSTIGDALLRPPAGKSNRLAGS